MALIVIHGFNCDREIRSMEKKGIEKYHFRKDEPKKRQFDIYDLGEYFDLHEGPASKPHSHSFYQIIWFIQGKGEHFIDFENYEIKANQLFFIAKNQVHYFDKNSVHQGYLIHFNESFLLNNEVDIDFFLNYSIFNNKQEPYFQIPSELSETISTYFSQIKKEAKFTDSFGNRLILSNLIKSFLLVIEREKRKLIVGDELSRDNVFLEFRDLLENHFKENWSVADFSKALSVSTKTLNKIVKMETGDTVSNFISDRIILEAKRQLTHSNIYVSDIAYGLGFKDPYYFAKYFKKKVNCTPSEFRNSIS